MQSNTMNYHNKEFKIGHRDELKPQKKKRGRWNLVAFCMALCLLARG